MSITGKVASIIDESTLIINVGEKAGVEKGVLFVIFEQGEEIKDPESGESLGNLEIVKAEVEAVHVQEQMTIVRAPLLEEQTASIVLSARLQEGASGAYAGGGLRSQKLQVRQGDISGVPQLHPIAVGDSVRSVAKGS